MLFAGYSYYPSGGWNDFQSFVMADTLTETELQDLKSNGYDWWQIASTQGIQNSGRL